MHSRGSFASAVPDAAVPQREAENVLGAFRAQCVHILFLCLERCGTRAALFFPFLILAVVEVVRLNRDQRIAKIGWRVVMASLIVCSFAYGADQTLEIYKRRDLERTVATIPEKKRIILLQSGTYEMEIRDLIRNPPDLWSADTLYFAYDNGVGIANLLKRFPEHSVNVYRYPGSLTPWSGERAD
jgi:hypothetical protein